MEESFDWDETPEATEIRVTVPADSGVTEDEVRAAFEELFENGADDGEAKPRGDTDAQTEERRFERGHRA